MDAKVLDTLPAAKTAPTDQKGQPDNPLSIAQPKWQRTVLDEKCRHGSFYSPLKPAADELRRSLQGAPPKGVEKVEPDPAQKGRPMSPMVALMIRHDY